jgi:hypothetical protein
VMTGGRRDQTTTAVGTGSVRCSFKTGEGKPPTGGPGWHSVRWRRQIQFEIEFWMNSNLFKL